VAPAANAACPCGREAKPGQLLKLADCCGPYLDDFENKPAPDAHSLMRSRYSAFVLERADYLLATWHPGTRPASLDFDPGARWLGLEVRAHVSTGPAAAEVEFVARMRAAGKAVRLHEHSRFVHEDGRWFYVDGDQL
jgi:SEC-C motif-containing protein